MFCHYQSKILNHNIMYVMYIKFISHWVLAITITTYSYYYEYLLQHNLGITSIINYLLKTRYYIIRICYYIGISTL